MGRKRTLGLGADSNEWKKRQITINHAFAAGTPPALPNANAVALAPALPNANGVPPTPPSGNNNQDYMKTEPSTSGSTQDQDVKNVKTEPFSSAVQASVPKHEDGVPSTPMSHHPIPPTLLQPPFTQQTFTSATPAKSTQPQSASGRHVFDTYTFSQGQLDTAETLSIVTSKPKSTVMEALVQRGWDADRAANRLYDDMTNRPGMAV
jgi:hypothetical protein